MISDHMRESVHVTSCKIALEMPMADREHLYGKEKAMRVIMPNDERVDLKPRTVCAANFHACRVFFKTPLPGFWLFYVLNLQYIIFTAAVLVL